MARNRFTAKEMLRKIKCRKFKNKQIENLLRPHLDKISVVNGRLIHPPITKTVIDELKHIVRASMKRERRNRHGLNAID